MSSDWEISGSLVFVSVIAFFFLLFQAESAVKRKQDMVTEGADSLSLAAVCCAMSREGQTKQLHPALGSCFVLDFLARAIFFGEIEWERGPSQPEKHKLMLAIMLG